MMWSLLGLAIFTLFIVLFEIVGSGPPPLTSSAVTETTLTARPGQSLRHSNRSSGLRVVAKRVSKLHRPRIRCRLKRPPRPRG